MRGSKNTVGVVAMRIPNEVVEQILKLRNLPNCPNMFDTYAVQRLAFDNELHSLVCFIEDHRKAYGHFILTGNPEIVCP